MTRKAMQWVNPDWSKARVHTAPEEMVCFGLGCPTGKILSGAHYTKHRCKTSGYYVDRPFCVSCHPVRQVGPDFDLREEWLAQHHQDDVSWLREWREKR